MKKIILFGAGKSTTALISYILKHSATENWNLIVVDANLQLATSKTAGHPNARASAFDINNDAERRTIIGEADIVISMLPPALHLLVAKDCIACQKNLLTASYVDDSMKALKPAIESNGLLFLCEMGLDPGVDHMSAMQLIQTIKQKGGSITSFRSHCGGLVAPESDNNPWHYKVSWNPINIVNAGKSGAVYKENDEINELDYYEVFENYGTVHVPALQHHLAWYANRDSLSYIPLYGLEDTSTFLRTTLRHPNYCIGWHAIVLAGLTDTENKTTINNFHGKSFNNWFVSSINFFAKAQNFSDFLTRYIDKENHELILSLFDHLGITCDEIIPDNAATSADILKYLLETRLALAPGDTDMVVMLHELGYNHELQYKQIKSSLIVKGDNNLHTAMAKTVGLPLAIAAKLILNGTITVKGLHIPTHINIYEPVLKELAQNGIVFQETE